MRLYIQPTNLAQTTSKFENEIFNVGFLFHADTPCCCFVKTRMTKKWTKNYDARVHRHCTLCRLLFLSSVKTEWTVKERTAKRAQALRRKTAGSVENILNVSCHFLSGSCRKVSLAVHERVTSPEELGTMSKKTLKRDYLGLEGLYGGFTLLLW